MVLKITLVAAIVLQLFAAIVAVGLTRVTKYNFSWMLISAALVFMAIRRMVEFLPYVSNFNPTDMQMLYSWLGIGTSIFFAGGVILIKKIFNYMNRVEQEKRDSEKQILNMVVQVEETQRKRFATELHDGLGPLLSTIKMGISAMEKSRGDNKEIHENIENALSEAIASVKEISNNLSPHVLTHFGVERALRNFINRLRLPTGFIIDFEAQIQSQRFSSSKETVIYRVACELINNTIRHAEASLIKIELTIMGNQLCLSYEDNGNGYLPWNSRVKKQARLEWVILIWSLVLKH